MSAADGGLPQCEDVVEPYNLALGVSSIFVVAIVSAMGFLTPAVLRGSMQGLKVQLAITAASAAGTGVLLVVALVHILADAHESLSSPCLPQRWLDAFPGWAFAFCAMTIMLMNMMDYALQGYYERKFEAAAEWEAMQEAHRASSDGPDKAAPRQTQSSLSRSFGRAMLRAPSAILLESDQLDLCKAESTGAPNDTEAGKVAPSGSTNHGMPAHGMPAHASLELKRGAVLFVEASVCTHSIPVGLSLGMQGGNSFVSLFIAVIIHQLLEGLGVGAAAVEGQFSTSKLLVLSAGFALTAPAGIALGVGVHSVLSSHDPHLLMALGIVNAIAAGMLLFVSIQHMNALSNRGRWLRQQSVAAQLLVLASFCAGGAAMIAVGKWA